MNKNLLLFYVINYHIDKVQNYTKNCIISFRKFNKIDGIMILIDKDSVQSILPFANEHNVTLLEFDIASSETHIWIDRFLQYSKNIDKISGFSKILTTDADVVFQSDPFANLPTEDFIYFFEEDGGVGIADQIDNSRPIEVFYGKERLDQIGKEKIICGGVILGSGYYVLKFLNILVKEIYSFGFEIVHSIRGVPADQNAINHLCRTEIINEFSNCEIRKNGDLATNLFLSLVHPLAKDDIKLDLRENTISVNGKIPSMVHQYPRSKFLTTFFNGLYLS